MNARLTSTAAAPARAARIAIVIAVIVLGAVLAGSTNAQVRHVSLQEYLFKTPSGNIYCDVASWDSLSRGLLTVRRCIDCDSLAAA